MAKRKSSSKTKAKSKALLIAEGKPRCKARLKTCRDCGYRYEGGDKSWECPECGEARRCTNKALTPYAVCRVHGAGGGRPPIHGKFSIPTKYIDRFNSIRQDPELMSLAYNIALSETRIDELLQQINENDARAAHVEIISAIRVMEFDAGLLEVFISELLLNEDGLSAKEVRELIPEHGFRGIFTGIAEIKQAVEPRSIEDHLWREVSFQLELTRRLNDTERKWATAHDQMIPIGIALEAIRTVMRDALEFITAPKDRQRFSDRIKGYLGE